jgi:alkanesulfonate monooxygenase SsuD/methylene tetrahydromethanopterin reductase-like flavin-dependent oxidoreductase (luciferase family)
MRHLDEIKRAAEAAGRSLDNFESGLFVHVAVAEKYEEALNQVRKAKAQIAFSPKMIREAGSEVELPSHLPENLYAGVTLTEESFKSFEELGKHVPDEVAVEFSIVGTA